MDKSKIDYTLYLCTDRGLMSCETIEQSVEEEDAAGTAKPNKSGFVKSKVTSPAFAILKAATTVNNESNNFLIIIMFLKITLQSYVIF